MTKPAGWQHVIHPWITLGQEAVRFGVALVGHRPSWVNFVDWVQRAEALGFDSFWVPDHPMLIVDCWTQLAALAVTTKTIRLGSLVSCVYHRSPALLARLTSDVDRLSEGRLVLRVGIGRLPSEFSQMGLPYRPTAEGQRGLEETILILRGMWGDEPFSYQREQFGIQDSHVQPPGQEPYVPILIAGGGQRSTLRQVARHGDMSNFGPLTVTGGVVDLADVKRRLATLDQYCEEEGRPPDSVLRSHYVIPLILAETPSDRDANLAKVPSAILTVFRIGLVSATVDEIIAYYKELSALGMRYFIASLLPNDQETLRLLDEYALPALTAERPGY